MMDRVFLIFLCTFTFAQSQQEGLLHVDSLQDFHDLQWSSKPAEPYFVNSVEELDYDLRGLPEASGVLYFKGDPELANQKIIISTKDFEDLGYYGVYLKYCLVGTDEGRTAAYVSPTGTRSSRRRVNLEPTELVWQEIVLSLEPQSVNIIQHIEIGVDWLPAEGYFLLDRVALVYGRQMTLEEIRQAFIVPDSTTTFSPSTSTAESSSTANIASSVQTQSTTKMSTEKVTEEYFSTEYSTAIYTGTSTSPTVSDGDTTETMSYGTTHSLNTTVSETSSVMTSVATPATTPVEITQTTTVTDDSTTVGPTEYVTSTTAAIEVTTVTSTGSSAPTPIDYTSAATFSDDTTMPVQNQTTTDHVPTASVPPYPSKTSSEFPGSTTSSENISTASRSSSVGYETSAIDETTSSLSEAFTTSSSYITSDGTRITEVPVTSPSSYTSNTPNSSVISSTTPVASSTHPNATISTASAGTTTIRHHTTRDMQGSSATTEVSHITAPTTESHKSHRNRLIVPILLPVLAFGGFVALILYLCQRCKNSIEHKRLTNAPILY